MHVELAKDGTWMVTDGDNVLAAGLKLREAWRFVDRHSKDRQETSYRQVQTAFAEKVGAAMSAYEPELGQALFGQPHREFDVPQVWTAALVMLRLQLEILRAKIKDRLKQSPWSDPFGNTGGAFECAAFEVQAYSWSDQEQPFNFKWGDVEISWYKYLGRGMSANQQLSPDRASEMLISCLAALRQLEVSSP